MTTSQEEPLFSNEAAELRRRLLLEYSFVRPYRPRSQERLIYLQWIIPPGLWLVVYAFQNQFQMPFFGILIYVGMSTYLLLGWREPTVKKLLPVDRSGKVTLESLNKIRSKRKQNPRAKRWLWSLVFALWISMILHNGISEGGDPLIRSIATTCWISLLFLMPMAFRPTLGLSARCANCNGKTHPREKECRHCQHDLSSIYGMYIPKRVVVGRGYLVLAILLSVAYVVLSLMTGVPEGMPSGTE